MYLGGRVFETPDLDDKQNDKTHPAVWNFNNDC